MIDLLLIILLSYMVLLLEKQATVNLGYERSYFCNIDLLKRKKLYAPFKYRVFGLWLARIFGVTSKECISMEFWGDRYMWNIYLLNQTGVEKYYIFKFCLFLFANFSFYIYLVSMGLSGFIGVCLLNLFICLTFIYDCFDYLIEIGLYSLFLVAISSSWGVFAIMGIAFVASLNRESAIFMIPIALYYCTIYEVIAAIFGFLFGFIIPRILYREVVDHYDGLYGNPFKFLVFNPITNWRLVLANVKQRFNGVTNTFHIRLGKNKMGVARHGVPVKIYIKDRFLNRIFLGIAFILFYFILIIAGISDAGEGQKVLAIIFTAFVLMISIPSDIREIRVYAPALIVMIPYIMMR